MANAYQLVTVHVPEERLAEFYRFFATWLAAKPDTTDQPASGTPLGLDEDDPGIMKH